MSKESRRKIYNDIADEMCNIYHNARLPYFPDIVSEYLDEHEYDSYLNFLVESYLHEINNSTARRHYWARYMRNMFGDFELHGKYGSTFTNESLFIMVQGGARALDVKSSYLKLYMAELRKILNGLAKTNEYVDDCKQQIKHHMVTRALINKQLQELINGQSSDRIPS
jgi:hypothetical protein